MTLKVKTRKLLEECVERGVTRGIEYAFKNDDTPSRFSIEQFVNSEISCEFNEYFYWDDDEEEKP